MSRLILIIAIAAMVYLLVRAFRKNTLPEEDKPVVDDMVQCEHCGVHLPKKEGVQANGHYFCCAEHRDAHGK